MRELTNITESFDTVQDYFLGIDGDSDFRFGWQDEVEIEAVDLLPSLNTAYEELQFAVANTSANGTNSTSFSVAWRVTFR